MIRHVPLMLLAWLLALTAAAPHAGAQPGDFQALARGVAPSVVTILGFDVGVAAPRSQGTGFFVAPDVVATNHHVIRDMGFVEVRVNLSDPPLRVLRVLDSDPFVDVALLEVEEAGAPLPLSSRLPSPGEEIMVISSPLGLEKTVTRGVISGLREIDGRTVCQITAAVSRGSSGGPILDKNGEVLGMTSFTVGGELTQNLNFGVLADAIRELMERDGNRANTRLRITTGDHGEIVITE